MCQIPTKSAWKASWRNLVVVISMKSTLV